MKLIYAFVFSFIYFNPSFAQAPDWSWVKQIEGDGDVHITDMGIDQYGWIYSTGYLDIYSPITIGNTTLAGTNGYLNPFLVKYNEKGDVAWAIEPLEAPSTDGTGGGTITTGSDVAIDKQGNVYLSGISAANYIVFGADTIYYTGYLESYLAKYDAGGNAIWSVGIHGNSGGGYYNWIQTIHDVAVDHDGYVYCLGNFTSDSMRIDYINNGITKDTLITGSKNVWKMFLVKYTPEGDLVWIKMYGASGEHGYPQSLIVASDNTLLVCGRFGCKFTVGFYSFTASDCSDGFVLRVDTSGNVTWALQVGSTAGDQVNALVEINNTIYLVGYFGNTGSDLTLGSFTLVNKGMEDVFIIKINSNGNVAWAKSYGSTLDDYATAISLTENENIYVTGVYKTDMIVGNDTLYNTGNQQKDDVFLLKLDSAGNEKWTYNTVGNQYDYRPFVKSRENNLYFAGQSSSSPFALGNDTLINGTFLAYFTFLASFVDFSDTVSIIDTSKVYRPDNGGLYGGSSAELTYTKNNRLFSGIQTPASMFISDDGAQSWYQAFDHDSLEYIYNGTERGWSGKATRILSNQTNWVAVQTNHPKNKYSSVVISFANGDTNTYKTAIDPTMLNNFGYGSYTVSAIALSDYNLYAALGPCIVNVGSGPINSSTDIKNIVSTISGLVSTSTINSIAVANNSNAYPYYIAIDEIGNENGYNRNLYKYNGTAFSKLNLPSNLNGIRAVFTHPTQITGDTVFITAKDKTTNAFKIYRSFDSGTNWTDISYASATDFLSDVDYSAGWNLSASNNVILIIPGNAISKDLGATWEILSDTAQIANVINPNDVNTIVGSDKTIEISTSGSTGTFSKAPNYGLEALQVNKIAKTESENIFYLATKTGLGYTKSYLDTSLSASQKWSAPYGEFPLLADTINFGSVAIDPTDSLHVIAGSPYGFYVTTTGPNGFSKITPTNFTSNNPQVNDIVFINHLTAIAVTGGDSAIDTGKGNIWKTTDGGLTWINVSPSNFASGNAIAIGNAGLDTVIYVGTGLLNIDEGYLYKSTDIGITWTKIKNGPTSMSGTSILGLPINDVAVDPRGKDTIYIAAGYENEYAFVLSFDGGETFIYLNAYGEKPYTSIDIHKVYPDTVYAASGREIYLYDLANNNFRFLYRVLPDEQIPDIVTGSILVGSTTGFYTFHPAYEDKADTNVVTQQLEHLPNGFIVNVYPNPFEDEATIRLVLKENANVSIDLLDLSGREITSIYNGKSNKGTSNYVLSAAHLASGTYFICIKVNNESSRRLLYHAK